MLRNKNYFQWWTRLLWLCFHCNVKVLHSVNKINSISISIGNKFHFYLKIRKRSSIQASCSRSGFVSVRSPAPRLTPNLAPMCNFNAQPLLFLKLILCWAVVAVVAVVIKCIVLWHLLTFFKCVSPFCVIVLNCCSLARRLTLRASETDRMWIYLKKQWYSHIKLNHSISFAKPEASK